MFLGAIGIVLMLMGCAGRHTIGFDGSLQFETREGTVLILRRPLIVAVVALAILTSMSVADAKTFRWAFQGDAQSLDPHGLNEGFTLGFLGNVYEGLTAYGPDLELVPALAESWETLSPTSWLFKLRRNVRFHDGNEFTADDVIFSWKRAASEGSDMKGYAAKVAEIRKLDDHTIEIETPSPNPILPRELAFLYMMDKEWSETNGTTVATNVRNGNVTNFANLHANGTGPFYVVDRQPDVKTVLKRYNGYWKSIKTDINEGIMTPIPQDATRVAALLSGQVDLAYPIPLQDLQRLEHASDVRPLTGAEARTIFLGMDQSRSELLYSSVKGKNPFKDQRVRAAIAHGIDVEAIKMKIMRGASWPTGLMVAPQINGFDASLNTPYVYDQDRAKQLLAEAGYADGFEVTLDCPNNRYINDEKICVAVAAMLAKIGIVVRVLAQPKSKFFAKVLAQNGYDTSFYLLGWIPATFDSHNVLFNLLSCRNNETQAGLFNLGNYCNKRVDELTGLVESETDPAKRQAMIIEAFRTVQQEVGYVPLHQQPLSWGVKEGVEVTQRADNYLDLRNVVMP
jgi:peptide/nickel transport system substrate-binding protein